MRNGFVNLHSIIENRPESQKNGGGQIAENQRSEVSRQWQEKRIADSEKTFQPQRAQRTHRIERNLNRKEHIELKDNLRGVRKFLDAPNPRGRVSNPPLQIPILFLRPLRPLRLIFRSESSSVAAAPR